MSNRRFAMYEYRQIIVRMRLGDSDRMLAKAGLIGRRKAGELRQPVRRQGWLKRTRALPNDATLAQVLRPVAAEATPAVPGSNVAPYREAVT